MVRKITFNDDVEVISFSRVFGTYVVPSEGLIAMSLGAEVGKRVEKLGHDQAVREANASPDCFKAPNQRAALLKQDIGPDAYHAQYPPLREEMISYKRMRQESALSEDDSRFFCETPIDAIEQGILDEAEVKTFQNIPCDDLKPIVEEIEVTRRWRASNNRKRIRYAPRQVAPHWSQKKEVMSPSNVSTASSISVFSSGKAKVADSMTQERKPRANSTTKSSKRLRTN